MDEGVEPLVALRDAKPEGDHGVGIGEVHQVQQSRAGPGRLDGGEGAGTPLAVAAYQVHGGAEPGHRDRRRQPDP